MIPDAIYYIAPESEHGPTRFVDVRASQRNTRPWAVDPAEYFPLGSTAIAESFSGNTTFNASWSYTGDPRVENKGV